MFQTKHTKVSIAPSTTWRKPAKNSAKRPKQTHRKPVDKPAPKSPDLYANCVYTQSKRSCDFHRNSFSFLGLTFDITACYSATSSYLAPGSSSRT